MKKVIRGNIDTIYEQLDELRKTHKKVEVLDYINVGNYFNDYYEYHVLIE